MRSPLPWAVLGALVVADAAAAAAAGTVNVALEASFGAPPFLLELLETAALENATAYFPLLDRVAAGHFADCSTDRDLYGAFVRLLADDGHLAGADALAAFRLALALHAAAPRIQAHYQYYATSVAAALVVAQDGACPAWVHLAGRQYCSPALERAQQDFAGPTNDLPFDRVLGLDPALAVSTLYVDVDSPLFASFHQTLAESARAGRTAYRIRYRPPPHPAKPLVVSGYGVELALKKTDYIVIDDRDAGTDDAAAEPKDGVLGGDAEKEQLADLKPLSASELLGLGSKASSYVMASSDPFDTLLKVSQDFPKHSSAISKLNASVEFVAEHRANRAAYLAAGQNVVWINGMQIHERQMDAFALLEKLRHERQLMGSLKELGLTGPEAVSLISHPKIAESKVETETQRYDYRDALEGGDVIIWLNDIEKDGRYEDWPTEAAALLQPVFPGQLPTVRRDIHNLVMPLDLTNFQDTELLVETLQAFVQRKVPVRFGVIPTLKTPAAEQQAKALYYLLDRYGLLAVLTYLATSIKNNAVPAFNEERFEATIKDRTVRNSQEILSIPTILGGERYQDRVKGAHHYLRRLGADGMSPVLFVNGVVQARNDGWLQTMSNQVQMDLIALQRQIYEQTIPEDAWLAGQYLLGAITHRNALIIPEDETTIKVFDLGNLVKEHARIYAGLPQVPASDDALKQFWAHLIVIADLDSDEGSKLVAEAMEFRMLQTEIQVVPVHNPSASDAPNYRSARLFELLTAADKLDPAQVATAMAGKGSESSGIDPSQPHEMAEAFWESMQPFAAAFGMKPGQTGVVLNGRLAGPIPNDTSFTAESFQQLLTFERARRITPANTALASLGLEDKMESPLAAARLSSLIALSTVPDIPEGVFESTPTSRVRNFQAWATQHSAITTGDFDTASTHVVASIDPTSEVAQRWIPILKVLSELSGVYLQLFLNPRERMQELPVKRFYRHVLDSKPSFEEDGSLRSTKATFDGLPSEALLSLAMDVPPAWLVAPKASVQDLDNIKLGALKDGADVNAVYELEHILIEGHSRDTSNGQPPRGVRLLLGTEKNPHFADTLIMANLGYFQFKANPGYWNVRLQAGRSQQIFDIESIGANGMNDISNDAGTEVALMSFQGKTLFPRLARKKGQEAEDVLEESQRSGSAREMVSKGSKLASSFLSKVGIARAKAEHAEINIFSVASGHLYERMLNIMMVSVMKHTQHTVKFWFIEQFLSPSFKATLPSLAAAYAFEYEMVTYKWPHWLRSQKEKQREIWGYKILFLDVLFPLSLDKVIFVDADQIVRTDMHDLVTHDLQGAPYGFTPMCDSRTEMEGFRFWKQGYWKNYLRGLPYHISALYVVDLRRFRQMAAGDRLRQQYHALSADPNSLSNLDQDLPNHMQMALPIHSLPQDWLWCETWCSDAALRSARTIDLCNNPLTKEPKLDRARRQVPEWTVYDDEIAAVFDRARAGEAAAEEAADGPKVRDEL